MYNSTSHSKTAINRSSISTPHELSTGPTNQGCMVGNKYVYISDKYRHHIHHNTEKASNYVTLFMQCIFDWLIYVASMYKEYKNKVYSKPLRETINQQQQIYGYVATTPVAQRPVDPFTMLPFDTDSYPIVIDTGCSRSISSYIADFIPDTLRTPTNQQLGIQGIEGSKICVQKIGTIKWCVLDDTGKNRTVLLPDSFYVPSTHVRLLSPQHMAQNSTEKITCTLEANSMIITWKVGQSSTVPISQDTSNIATIWSVPGYASYKAFRMVLRNTLEAPLEAADIINEETINRNKSEGDIVTDIIDEPPNEANTVREGPLNLDLVTLPSDLQTDMELDNLSETFLNLKKPEELKLMWHYKLGHISMDRIDRLAKLGYLPRVLASCAHPLCQACIYGKMTRRPWRTKPALTDVKSENATAPGEVVSVDQIESPVPGLVGQSKGIPTKARTRVATIYVDHFSSLSFVYLQQSTTGEETMRSKDAFEAYAGTYGITIKRYQADNGRFAENLWRKSVMEQKQALTFSGVGAHHQNGRAEKRIRDLQDLARSSLIHAHSKWPDAVSTHLWPYALRHANECINNTPFKDKQHSPIELFSGMRQTSNLLQLHPFGCPAYVLDDLMQAGNKAPKWGTRARMGLYLGTSAQHARTVSMILSLTTGMVSAQFHIRFDDAFQTVTGIRNFIVRSSWQTKVGFNTKEKDKRNTLEVENSFTDIPITEQLPIYTDRENIIRNEGALINEQENENAEEDSNQQPAEDNQVADQHDTSTAATPAPAAVVTRSGRTSQAPSRFHDYVAFCVDTIQINPYFAMVASSDPDILYLHEAMKAPDHKEFIKAMIQEVNAHIENKNWKIVNRSDIPAGKKVVPSVWAMRRKRDIVTQMVYKWKARLNFHGGKQVHGIDYWDTYAPVAHWHTIRFVLFLAVLNYWITKQMDYVLAFPQAPAETDLFMSIPPGFTISGDAETKALQLLNNLYGTKQAGRIWNRFLTAGLIKLGFIQSTHDECLFWRDKVILVLYTDDTIVTGPKAEEVDKAIADIGKVFKITYKDCVDEFLGVKVVRDVKEGIIYLTQPQLIDSIINDLSLSTTSNTRSIPALSTIILHKYESSAPHEASWSYRSVIGKLNYLAKSTRPDIEYAVHQCARFAAEPKVEHTQAVKLIGRYLLGTRGQGLICKPTSKSFECFCDADFSGGWDPSIAEFDQTTARSRSGYLIKYADCPIVWASKLQTEIALSSTESEYIALSQGLREIIPMMRLIEELKGAGFDLDITTPKVHCSVFEDNNGALEMARTPKMRPRTKHINIKYHHFRSHVEDNLISIHPIDTLDQQADIFTKPLASTLFLKFRKLILGW